MQRLYKHSQLARSTHLRFRRTGTYLILNLGKHEKRKVKNDERCRHVVFSYFRLSVRDAPPVFVLGVLLAESSIFGLQRFSAIQHTPESVPSISLYSTLYLVSINVYRQTRYRV